MKFILVTVILYISVYLSRSANILIITMCATFSHKIPFLELAKGLIPRGHNIVIISAFAQDSFIDGLEEISPTGLVSYSRNFTDWDLLGRRMRGEQPVHPMDAIRFGYEVCEMLLSDPMTKDFMNSGRKFELIILDGAYPECGLGFTHHFKVPFIYFNTISFYTGSLSLAGNPAPFSVTPYPDASFTDNMNVMERTINTICHIVFNFGHALMVRVKLQGILYQHFGEDVPPIYEMSKNVSFILQHGYVTVTYPRSYLPNVAEIACIHCRKPKILPSELEEFISDSGDAGFILVSMGSTVKAANMPHNLRRMLFSVFRQLKQRVLCKWELDTEIPDLPSNVKLSSWLPQQDLLGHPKIRAFITQAGQLSIFETVYHGVPIVTLPVFCDQDAIAAKAALDGYAIKLDLKTLTANLLLRSIKKVIYEPKYKEAVKQQQFLLLDQKETPLELAIYWTEYVLKHRGAKHLQSPSKDLNVIQYYLVDVVAILLFSTWLIFFLLKLFLKLCCMLLKTNSDQCMFKKSIKIE